MSRFHQANITKGVFGELSKIQEELDEAVDAEAQGQTLMLLIELSDIVGAVAGVARKHGFSLEELSKFARLRSQVALSELNTKAYLQRCQEEDQRNALGFAVEQALNKERGLPYDEEFMAVNQLNDLFPPNPLDVFAE